MELDSPGSDQNMAQDPETPSEDPFTAVAPYYDHLMQGVPYRFWVAYLQQVWQHHGLTPQSILDIACGTGTATRMLAAKGYRVTGVDLSEGMLVAARERGRSEALEVDYYRQDAAELDLGESRFDAAISLFDSLNYILEPERLREALRRICAHLGPGGSFLFDLNTEYALAEGMFNQSCSRRDEPLHYRWRSSYDADTRICTVKMRFSYDGSGERKVFREVHRQRAYHKDEIRIWLLEAGFEDAHIYDAYTMEPARKKSDRLFFLGIKSAETSP